MDGFGINKPYDGNAIYNAKTPNLDKFFAEYPTTQIGASGMDVGLPDGQMGNSEVGHTNIGAGRIVYQELTRITKSIKDGDFFDNAALMGAMENCKKNGSALHLIGLTSDGGVHSHNTHLYALLEMAKRNGLDKVYCHALLDGRDVPPASGADYVAELQAKMNEIGVGKVATTMGRYYAMDRDNRWERVGKAYAAMVYGEGEFNPDPVDAIKKSYETIDEEGKHLTDEFVLPVVCVKDAGIKADDVITAINGVTVKTMAQLQEQIARFRPGDKVKVTVNRKGDTKNFTATLKNSMGNTEVIQKKGIDQLGVTFKNLSSQELYKYGVRSGVQIQKLEQGGLFAKAGLREKMLIVTNHASADSGMS